MSTTPHLTRFPKPKPEPETVPLWEAAARTGIHERTIREAVKRDEFPGYMVGKRLVIPREGFEALMRGEWVPGRDRLEAELLERVTRQVLAAIDAAALGGRRTA